MKMVDMARTKSEIKAREKEWAKGPAPVDGKDDGPMLDLHHDHMQKIGMDETPSQGDEYAMQAHGRVHEVHDTPEGRHIVMVLHHMGAMPKEMDDGKSVRDDIEEAAESTERSAAEKVAMRDAAVARTGKQIAEKTGGR